MRYFKKRMMLDIISLKAYFNLFHAVYFSYKLYFAKGISTIFHAVYFHCISFNNFI